MCGIAGIVRDGAVGDGDVRQVEQRGASRRYRGPDVEGLRRGASAGEAELLAEAGKHVARYKLPKAFVFRDEIQRSPSGKADYRWAAKQASRG